MCRDFINKLNKSSLMLRGTVLNYYFEMDLEIFYVAFKKFHLTLKPNEMLNAARIV